MARKHPGLRSLRSRASSESGGPADPSIPSVAVPGRSSAHLPASRTSTTRGSPWRPRRWRPPPDFPVPSSRCACATVSCHPHQCLPAMSHYGDRALRRSDHSRLLRHRSTAYAVRDSPRRAASAVAAGLQEGSRAPNAPTSATTGRRHSLARPSRVSTHPARASPQIRIPGRQSPQPCRYSSLRAICSGHTARVR